MVTGFFLEFLLWVWATFVGLPDVVMGAALVFKATAIVGAAVVAITAVLVGFGHSCWVGESIVERVSLQTHILI